MSLTAFVNEWCFTPEPILTFGIGVGLQARKDVSPFIPTPCPSTRIGPGKLVFQGASGSLDPVYQDSRCAAVDCRPVYRPSVLDFPKVIWKEIISAPAEDP